MLYRLPEIMAAIAAGHEVWLAEGEKDADALTAAGVVAELSAAWAAITTNA